MATYTNTLSTFDATTSAFNPQYWSKVMQEVRYKENLAIGLCNTEQRAILRDGDAVNKPYRSSLASQSYTKGTDLTVQAIGATNEYLQVNTCKAVPFYVDDLDSIQNKWNTVDIFATDAQRCLNNGLDQAVLAEYSNATSTVYNADIGGSGATTAIPVTTANIANIFTSASRKLRNQNVTSMDRFAVISPRFMETLQLSLAGRETGFGDSVGANGYVGTRFGFELYVSNNLPFTARWTPANNPTNADTVTIAGVTFKFVTNGTAAAAGDVSIGGDTETTLNSLVEAVNGTGTAGASNYIAISDANREIMTINGVVASDGTTYLGLVGYGDIVVTMSEAADVWSLQKQHLLFGQKGAIDLVVQADPQVAFHQPELKLGKTVIAWMLYGKKTFAYGKKALVNVVCDASAWI